MILTEKLAYIRGLCDGLGIEADTNENKVLLALVDLLDDLTQEVSQHESDIEQLFEEIDAIDEDLSDVEDALLYDDEDFDDEDFTEEDFFNADCDCDGDCDCGDDCSCGGHHHGYDEENPIYEIECPGCGEVVCMDEEMLFSENCACPNCKVKFEIDYEGVSEGEE